jgi:hypothetical protein
MFQRYETIETHQKKEKGLNSLIKKEASIFQKY